MIGLEIVAPNGYGFVNIHCYSLHKGSNGYSSPSIKKVDGCEKVRDEPTRQIITTDHDDRDKVFVSASLTDKDGNMTPWSSVVMLKPMRTEEIAIPADFGTIS